MPAPTTNASADRKLAGLRRRIDAIDTAIHDLLARRVAIVGEVGRVKRSGGAVLARPGREAAILRRLAARTRKPLPLSLVIQIWREIIPALTSLQGAFTVAVHTRTGALARDHFGRSPLRPTTSLASALAATAKGQTQLSVIPFLDAGESPWWRDLSPGLNAIAALPFLASGNERPGAVVIGKQPFEPSGDDRILLTVETADRLTPAKLKPLKNARVLAAAPGRAGRIVYLVEADGGGTAPAADRTRTIRAIGGYARPLVRKG